MGINCTIFMRKNKNKIKSKNNKINYQRNYKIIQYKLIIKLMKLRDNNKKKNIGSKSSNYMSVIFINQKLMFGR